MAVVCCAIMYVFSTAERKEKTESKNALGKVSSVVRL